MVARALISLVALLSPLGVLAGQLRRSNGPVVKDSFIVVLKNGMDRTAHIDSIANSFSISDTENTVVVNRQYSSALNGYSASLKGTALDRILADPMVDFIAEDGIATINFDANRPHIGVVDAFGKRSTTLVTNGTEGAGVDIYGVDTGIYIAHNDFGGRASWGATFGDYADADGNGHGTHTASTAVGAKYGVAKAANIIAVKVLSDDGDGAYSDIIAGIDWVVDAVAKSGKPSVVNMSLGGVANSAVDQAVKTAIASGVHFAVAAGNDGKDASGSSPARVPEANTVGAVNTADRVASFSNIGPVVDVFALGVDVEAAWIKGAESTMILSGTSMASPHVAGYLAVALSQIGDTTPAALSALLTKNAEPVVIGQPRNTTDLLAGGFA